MKLEKSKILSILVLLLSLGLIILLFIDLFPLMREVFENRHDEDKMLEYIRAYGAKGMPILIGLQALQVIMAFFPAAAIQILAGLCYGIWLGSLLCLLGYVLGNMLVFTALRQFKSTLSEFLPKKDKTKKSKSFIDINRIKQMKNPEYAVVLLYLIPGIPNGLLPYIFADTKITYSRYLTSIIVGSIPSVLLCAWVGQALARRNYILAGSIVAVTVLLLAAIYFNRTRLTRWADGLMDRMKKHD